MGEIICNHCGYMNSHLQLHNENGLCVKCFNPLGNWCNECRELVCPSCHLWEHYNE